MRPREDTILLSDMLDYARRAVIALEGQSRETLGTDGVLAGALERFVEVIGEAAGRLPKQPEKHTGDPLGRDHRHAQ
jgi:uncharacterized protein with HEPN domain